MFLTQDIVFDIYVIGFMDFTKGLKRGCCYCKTRTMKPTRVEQTNEGVKARWECIECKNVRFHTVTYDELREDFNKSVESGY